MQSIDSSALKTILHSKRANIYLLEHCRVLVNGGRVEYVTDAGQQHLFWNIPIANTVTLLLGTGTSLTQAAMRELAKAGVMVGFCGGGGSPLFAGTEADIEVAWLSPQSEYRPTEYLQQWVKFWFDDELRLCAAKQLQATRLAHLLRCWVTHRHSALPPWPVDCVAASELIARSQLAVESARDLTALLTEEARLSKQLYKLAANASAYGEFSRSERGKSVDTANRFLDHGNYLAYGLAATATWVLGLPHGLAILHGKTRRGGLVFDVADLIKDALILPQAFLSAAAGDTEQEFRQACISAMTRTEALDFQIDTLKEISVRMGAAAGDAKP